MKNLSIVLILLATLASTPVIAEVLPSISGCWEWNLTEHVGAANETPETLGHSVQLEFRPDYTYAEYHNGELVREDTWRGGTYHTCLGIVMIRVTYAVVGDDYMEYGVGNDSNLMISGGGSLHDNPDVVAHYVPRSPVPVASMSWGDLKSEYR